MTTDGDLRNRIIESEYEKLRDEVLMRLRLRQQVLYFTLIAGTALLGLIKELSISALVIFPLGAVLALTWLQHDLRIGQIGHYLRTEFSKPYGLERKGWELYLRKPSTTKAASRLQAISYYLSTIVLQLSLLILLIYNDLDKAKEYFSYFNCTKLLFFLLIASFLAFCMLTVLYCLIRSLLSNFRNHVEEKLPHNPINFS